MNQYNTLFIGKILVRCDELVELESKLIRGWYGGGGYAWVVLDLTNLYNSRMAYTSEAEAIQNTEIGEANNYILNDSFVFNKIHKKDKVSGIFY